MPQSTIVAQFCFLYLAGFLTGRTTTLTRCGYLKRDQSSKGYSSNASFHPLCLIECEIAELSLPLSVHLCSKIWGRHTLELLLEKDGSPSAWGTNESMGASVFSDRESQQRSSFRAVLKALNSLFRHQFTLINVESGDIVHSHTQGLNYDLYDRIALLAEVERRGRPEIVEQISPLAMLAIPMRELGSGSPLVAVGLFLTAPVENEEQISLAAESFGMGTQRVYQWGRGEETWTSRVLLQMAETSLDKFLQERQIDHLRGEINEAILHARDTYVELGLLHRLTKQLNIARDNQVFRREILGWLAAAIPAQCLTLLSIEPTQKEIKQIDRQAFEILSQGSCPLEESELLSLVVELGAVSRGGPILINRSETSLVTWNYPTVKEMVCIPLAEGKKLSGWLVALNHKGNRYGEIAQFGSVEIRLLNSVGTILGIHANNRFLYQKQAELFSGSIQALTCAIDAKDRYTSGHSERVARVSVLLAKQLGLCSEELDKIYLAGLLHDIGKIGIDDQILNKPGNLSTEEFAHIRRHPELGYEILRGVRQLDEILPAVLYHHENWDGTGYPHGLRGKETPKPARIIAVADAFDAMSSDRPYRKGMPLEVIEEILQKGSGTQWDPEVVEAYFAVRKEIRRIPNTLEATDFSALPRLVG